MFGLEHTGEREDVDEVEVAKYLNDAALGCELAHRAPTERNWQAAARHLRDLNRRFKSLYLAAAAYNVGQGRVAREMKRATGSTKGTDADYYRIASRLPQETRDYVPKMIAAARIAKDPAKYGFEPVLAAK